MSGQRGHREPPDVSRPNHYLRATWHSAESRCKSRSVDGLLLSLLFIFLGVEEGPSRFSSPLSAVNA